MSPLDHDSRARVTCFVLAGGQGERLRPLTWAVPKPLLQFGGVHRLLDFTLSNIAASGVGPTYVLTQYLSDSIGTYLRRWSATLDPSSRPIRHQPPTSGKRYRSTGDAVGQNLRVAPDHSDLILVLSADHVYQLDYRRMIEEHLRSGAGATVGAVPVALDSARELGVLSLDSAGTIVDFAEKPKDPLPMESTEGHALASMGVYLFDRRVLSRALGDLQDRTLGPDFGRDVIPYLVEQGQASAYLATGDDGNAIYWRDVGTLQTYYDANMHMLMGFCPIPRSPAREALLEPRSGKSGTSIVASSARLGDCRVRHSILSGGARVDDGADVFGSILLPGAHVGRGAVVRNTIVDAWGEIRPGARTGQGRARSASSSNIADSDIVVVPGPRTRPVGDVGTALDPFAALPRYAKASDHYEPIQPM